MKKILLSMAAVAALAATAAPAAAQDWRRDGRGYEGRGYDQGRDYDQGRGYDQGQRITGRYDALEWQLNNAAQEGRMSRGEARELLSMWRQNQPLAWRVETGRASGGERQRVMRTMNVIERALAQSQRYSRYDRDDRGYGRDWRR
jgi:Ni/Co efflux regulator RcnB